MNLANRLQFAKLKSSKVVVTINNSWADVFIRQTFFSQPLEKSKFTKHSLRHTFPLYGIWVGVGWIWKLHTDTIPLRTNVQLYILYCSELLYPHIYSCIGMRGDIHCHVQPDLYKTVDV